MTVKLASSLPVGDGNGLAAILDELVGDPAGKHVTVAIVDTKRLQVDTDTGEVVPTVRLRRVEAVDPADAKPMMRLLSRAYEKRTGKTVLPFELEEDVREAFGTTRVDPTTGEITN